MVDFVGFDARGVAVWLGVVVGFRVPSRLGAVLDRVGVGLTVFAGVGVGVTDAVRRGVADGLVGRIGVGVTDASSTGVEAAVSGSSWLVTF
ncbi:hypothetical protein GCM10009745_50380 [Kribbella yunnanensis]|uniref:Uncharacterized protein n=1 Tax=Kribbella yunnanensis TaxID=190194 RepID=A0ABP4U3T5_9ACTN